MEGTKNKMKLKDASANKNLVVNTAGEWYRSKDRHIYYINGWMVGVGTWSQDSNWYNYKNKWKHGPKNWQ